MAGDTIAGRPPGGQADQPLLPSLPPTPILADLLKRAGNAQGYQRWADQVRHARYCTRPVRLAGAVEQADAATGEARTVFDTSSEPDGIVLKACGTRRAARCQPCARVYQADAYQLVKAGVAGGKSLPDTVAAHPRVFATFTAPSFGRVHTRREQGGTAYPCHTAKLGERCDHGRRRSCWHKHQQDDPALGSPLCADCYDYQGAVIWNALAPVLWRRTTIYLRRALARLSGKTVATLAREVRISYVKVAEYQTRGAIHYHAVIRLDGIDDGEMVAPPAWATVELLTAAIHHAASAAGVPCPGGLGSDPVGWGSQLDIRPITAGVLGDGTEGHVAGYLAKYATKATENLAGVALDRPIRSAAEPARLELPEHIRRLVQACWALGARPELRKLRLRAWAHQLGYGGHCLSKSRRYSVTFGALRRARHEHTRRQAFGGGEPTDAWGRPEHERAIVVVSSWSYQGRGYTTLADAWLARSLLENSCEKRRVAGEGLTAVA